VSVVVGIFPAAREIEGIRGESSYQEREEHAEKADAISDGRPDPAELSGRTEQYSEADFLAHAGIPVLIDDKHQIAHNKIMVIDANVVITGSFNFTKATEEHNAENLLVIRNRDLAARYTDNWNTHSQHSVPYSEK
jgi:phosphatidylserine/phosphatidylglycerophosphate/cardiolipin synthase-like enzyme